METIALYLLKSAALMAAFFLAYHVLLRRETFFKSNRWYLLFGLITSLVLPFVTFTKVILVEPVKQIERWENVAMSEVDAAAAYVTAAPKPETFEVDWFLVLSIGYALVALALFVKFTLDFYSLRKIIKGKMVQRQADYKFVDVPENVAPFSYFSYIVYNSSLYTKDELVNILEHEKVHSAQQHTVDVLISRLVCIAFWWNPFVWLYKKAILQNLEFIADSEALKNVSDSKAYQITLLKITTHESCVAVTNHFFQSLIKKRIVMLNKNQSSKWNSWKYLLIVPALAAFLFYFQVKVIAQEKQADLTIKAPQERIEVVVDKNTSDAELKNHTETLKKEHDIKLKFSKVKRNKSGEITGIKAEFKDNNGKKGVTQVSGDEPIKPIHFYKSGNAIGFRSGSESKNIRIVRSDDDDSHSFSFSHKESSDEDESDDIAENINLNINVDSIMADQKIVVATRNGNKRTVIVNGKEVTGEQADKIMLDIKPAKIRGFSKTHDGDSDMVISVNGEEVFTSSDLREITSAALAEASRAISEARPDMEHARDEMRKAAEEMKRSHKEMAKKHKELALKKRDEAYLKRNEARELNDAQREIEQAREEIKQAQEELKQMRAELEKERNKK